MHPEVRAGWALTFGLVSMNSTENSEMMTLSICSVDVIM
jgi:hypothetical protein